MLCVTLDHKEGCFDCSLQQLVAEILGIPKVSIPKHWLYRCENPQLSIAVTLKNALVFYTRLDRGEEVNLRDLPWHVQYNGRKFEMVCTLEREAYFEKN
jgi:hypothetical protein